MVKNPPANAGDVRGFDLWVGKISWRKKWYPTPAFLPGKFYGQRNLWTTVHGATKSWMELRARMRVRTHTHTHTHRYKVGKTKIKTIVFEHLYKSIEKFDKRAILNFKSRANILNL